MKSFGYKPNGNFAKLKISQTKSATTSNLLPGPPDAMGRTIFEKRYWFIGSRLQPESAACTASSAKPYPLLDGAVPAIRKQVQEIWEKNMFFCLSRHRLRELGRACGWSSFFRHPGATHAFIEPLALRHIDRMGRQGIRAQ